MPAQRPAQSPRHSIELVRLHGAMKAMPEQWTSDFKRAAEQAPFLLRTIGLGPGLAVMAKKPGSESAELATMLAKWLLDRLILIPGIRQDPLTIALHAIAASDRRTYRVASIEAIGFASTIKRLAQAGYNAKPEALRDEAAV